jgi:hypothetical protein
MFRSVLCNGYERKSDLDRVKSGKVYLSLFSRIFKPLKRDPVVPEVDIFLFLKLLHKEIYYGLVKIVPSQMRVAAG